MSELGYAEPSVPTRPAAPREPQLVPARLPAKQRHPRLDSTVETPRNRRRVVYAAVTVTAILFIVVVQLLLSVGLSQGAYRLETLHDETKELGRTAQSVRQDIQRLSSPQNLAANAEALGMVKNASPVYLRLSDGAVLGMPSSAASSAGLLVGAAGVLVPNSLLNGVPLAEQPPQNGPGAPPAVANAAPPAGAVAPASTPPAVVPAPPPVVQAASPAGGANPPPNGGLASPTTH
jgi:hypothetical protein